MASALVGALREDRCRRDRLRRDRAHRRLPNMKKVPTVDIHGHVPPAGPLASFIVEDHLCIRCEAGQHRNV